MFKFHANSSYTQLIETALLYKFEPNVKNGFCKNVADPA